MVGILIFGFLIGMSHALEADHLAAVGAMAVHNKSSKKSLALRGAVWGAGHTISLFGICALVLITGIPLTDQVSAMLEFAVGIMLVVIGIDVIRRIRQRKIHFHVHHHDEGKPHLHAHSHEFSQVPHEADTHQHAHPTGLPIKALFVGITHGAAGSAALLVLIVAATQDVYTALGYVLFFGMGSILGMTVLSLVVAWPLSFAEKQAYWLHRGISYSAALVAIILGTTLMFETGQPAFLGGS